MNKYYLHGLNDGRTIFMNENYKTRVYEIPTNDATGIVKRRFRNRSIKFLNQIESSIEINKYYLQDLKRSITSNIRKLQMESS